MLRVSHTKATWSASGYQSARRCVIWCAQSTAVRCAELSSVRQPGRGSGHRNTLAVPPRSSSSRTVGACPAGLATVGAFPKQLYGLYIHGDQRALWGLGARRAVQDLFHVGHTVRAFLGRHHPTLVYVWLQEVCVRVWRMVA